jgi:hypothetical protein
MYNLPLLETLCKGKIPNSGYGNGGDGNGGDGNGDDN